MINRLTIAAAVVLGLASTTASGAPASQAMGTWINPRGSVMVRTAACGSNLCGRVVWASRAAQADARASGVAPLVGLQLLRNYHSTGPGRYAGRVYVPDMGRSFQSFIEQYDANNLRISGCVLHGLICKSQAWRRA